MGNCEMCQRAVGEGMGGAADIKNATTTRRIDFGNHGGAVDAPLCDECAAVVDENAEAFASAGDENT